MNAQEHLQGTVTDLADELNAGNFEAAYDALDYYTIRDSRGNYSGTILLITTGGPRVWVDTFDQAVIGTMGYDKARAYLDRAACEAIDEYYSGGEW